MLAVGVEGCEFFGLEAAVTWLMIDGDGFGRGIVMVERHGMGLVDDSR